MMDAGRGLHAPSVRIITYLSVSSLERMIIQFPHILRIFHNKP
jgi:hypothetical protein